MSTNKNTAYEADELGSAVDLFTYIAQRGSILPAPVSPCLRSLPQVYVFVIGWIIDGTRIFSPNKRNFCNYTYPQTIFSSIRIPQTENFFIPLLYLSLLIVYKNTNRSSMVIEILV